MNTEDRMARGNHIAAAVGTILAIVVMMTLFLRVAESDFMPSPASTQLTDIKDQVASDAVTQYRMVESKGSSIDRCVHAGLVASAYLQAHNESAYALWRDVQTKDCNSAGASM